MWVKRQVEVGSTFALTPPFAAANELILIVEDDPKNLKLVRDTLQVRVNSDDPGRSVGG